ncbi:MAG: hypothetical protein ABR978_07870, partial [Dehalococcoidia bacterium]
MTAKCLRVLIGAIVIAAAVIANERVSPASSSAPQWYDVTSNAVQTFYQDYAPPQTDRQGTLLSNYDPKSSFLPIGIYDPEPCTTSVTFKWSPPVTPPPPGYTWDGTYRLWVFFPVPGQGLGDAKVVFLDTGTSTQYTVDTIPANVTMSWATLVWFTKGADATAQFVPQVRPDPSFRVDCPSNDVDDPNAIETLAKAGFNAAIAGTGIGHPYALMQLKAQAPDAENFTFVPLAIDAGFCPHDPNNPALYCQDPTCIEPQIDQTMFDLYKQDPNVFGFYLDDEPLMRAEGLYGQCAAGPAQYQSDWHITNILQSVEDKYASLESETDHSIFLTEADGYRNQWWNDF